MKISFFALLLILFNFSTKEIYSRFEYTVSTSSMNTPRDSTKKCLFEYFENSIIIGETEDDIGKNYNLRKPTSFTFKSIFTDPDSTINYYNIKTTVGINIFGIISNCSPDDIALFSGNNSRISLWPFIEYNKSTFAENKTDFLKYGAVASGFLNIKFHDANETFLGLLPAIGYSNARNIKDNERENQFFFDFTFAIKQNSTRGLSCFLPNFEEQQTHEKNFLRFIYSPNIGIEYSDIYISNSQNRIGNICRLYLKFFGTIKVFNDILNIQTAFHWRNVISNSANYEKKITRYFDISTNLDIIKIFSSNINSKKKGPLLLIGIDYINGENPWTGDEFCKTLQFCIKFKI